MQWNLNPSREPEPPVWSDREGPTGPLVASPLEGISNWWGLVVQRDPPEWNGPSVYAWDMDFKKDIMLTASSAAAHLPITRIKWSEPANLEILVLAFNEGPDRCSNEVLVGLVHELKVLMQSHSYQVLNNILRTAEFNSLSPEAVVAILRVPSAAKSLLREWRSAVARAKTELTARGLEADRILEGLL